MSGINLNNERFRLFKVYCNIERHFNRLINSHNHPSNKKGVEPVRFVYDYNINSIVLYDGIDTIFYSEPELKDQMIVDLFERLVGKKRIKKLKEKNSSPKIFQMYLSSKERIDEPWNGDVHYDR